MNFRITSGGLSLLLLVMTLIPANVDARQDSLKVKKLSLQEALTIADQQAFEVQMARQQQEITRSARQRGLAVFLPQLTVEEQFMETTDPVGVFGIKLRQGVIQNSDFNPATLNDPDAEQNFTTSIQLQQPLINPEGMFQRSASKFQYQSAQQKVKATERYQRFRVKDLYYRLILADSSIRVFESHLKAAKSFEKKASDYAQQGLINKADDLKTRVFRLKAEKQLLKARNERLRINDELRLLLGIPDDIRIQGTNPPEEPSQNAHLLKEDYSPNAALKALELQVKSTGEMLKAARSGFLPTLNLFGSYEWHDDSFAGNKANNYTIGASLKWDLFQGMKQKGLVNRRKAEYKNMELKFKQASMQLQNDIRKAQRSVDEALQNISLTSLSARETAEHLRIRKSRYEQGLENTSDLLQSQAEYLQARLSHNQALYQYQVSKAMLEYLTEQEL